MINASVIIPQLRKFERTDLTGVWRSNGECEKLKPLFPFLFPVDVQ